MHDYASAADANRLPLLVRTLHGIEDLAAHEIQERLSATTVRTAHREVRFESAQLEHALSLGVADDVFIVVFEGEATGRVKSELETLAKRIRSIDLNGTAAEIKSVRPVRGLDFDVTASFLGARNFTRFDIEDAVGLSIQSTTGRRYRSRRDGRPSQTDLSLRVHLTPAMTTVAVRVAATPLHRRAYRVRSRPGALHPPLARALIRLVGADETATIADPFCGTGTIPIEAKLCHPRSMVFGSDLDRAAISAAAANAAMASVSVDLRRADAGHPAATESSIDYLVSNPPWGSSVKAAGLLKQTTVPFWGAADRILTQAGRVVVTTKMQAHKLLPRESAFAVLDRRTVRLSGALIEILILGRR